MNHQTTHDARRDPCDTSHDTSHDDPRDISRDVSRDTSSGDPRDVRRHERRFFIRSVGAAVALAPWASLGFAAAGAPGGPRLVVVILRGGLDGLAAVPAVGDPSFAPARGPLAQFGADPLPLAAPFALHPQLAQLHAMYGRGEMLVVHATGLPYRERSHFDAQQVLESGGTRPYELDTGWLGRALTAAGARGIAINTAVPLLLRGGTAVDTWAPSVLPDPSPDLVARLEAMYARRDPGLAAALARARGLRSDGAMTTAMDGGTAGARGAAQQVSALARKAGEFLALPDGPMAAVLEIGGWDSHANQAAPAGGLSNPLRALDGGLAALRDALVAGGAWPRTAVVVATEFGREVAVNGTLGTDHGSGGAAFVLGGAVAGGRVLADWPGLAPRDRFEGRDLRITTDLRAVFKGVLADHLRVPRAALDRDVFPGADGLRPLALLRG